ESHALSLHDALPISSRKTHPGKRADATTHVTSVRAKQVMQAPRAGTDARPRRRVVDPRPTSNATPHAIRTSSPDAGRARGHSTSPYGSATASRVAPW